MNRPRNVNMTVLIVIAVLDLLCGIAAFYHSEYIFGIIDIVCFMVVALCYIYSLKKQSKKQPEER